MEKRYYLLAFTVYNIPHSATFHQSAWEHASRLTLCEKPQERKASTFFSLHVLQLHGVFASYRTIIQNTHKAVSFPTKGISNVGGIKITEDAAVSITYCAQCSYCSICTVNWCMQSVQWWDYPAFSSWESVRCLSRSQSLCLDSHGRRWINAYEASLDWQWQGKTEVLRGKQVPFNFEHHVMCPTIQHHIILTYAGFRIHLPLCVKHFISFQKYIGYYWLTFEWFHSLPPDSLYV